MVNGYYESEYEEAVLSLLFEQHWEISHGEALHRKFSDVLLLDDLKTFLQRNYQELSDDEVNQIVFNLRNTGGNTDYLSLRNVASLCVNGFIFQRADSTLPDVPIDYIDFEHWDNNVFRAVNQLTIREHGVERRPDILLFVNGIPLCIIELKNPAQRQATIFDAWEQIHVRYKRDIPSLMKFCLMSVISDGGAPQGSALHMRHLSITTLGRRLRTRMTLLQGWARCKRLSKEPFHLSVFLRLFGTLFTFLTFRKVNNVRRKLSVAILSFLQ